MHSVTEEELTSLRGDLLSAILAFLGVMIGVAVTVYTALGSEGLSSETRNRFLNMLLLSKILIVMFALLALILYINRLILIHRVKTRDNPAKVPGAGRIASG